MRPCQCPWHGPCVSITLLGEVERVTFENEETGFRVVRLGKVEGLRGHRRMTIVGVFQAIGPGTRVRVGGPLEDDAKHGQRVRVESLVVLDPETLVGVEKYLASGVVRGLGPGFAKRIVKCFGLDTLRVLDAESHRLAEVPGIGKARVDEIRAAWSEHRALSNVMLALQSYGVAPALAAKLVKQFGEKAQEIVERSPYRLAIDVVGVGFKTADKIARAQGIRGDHPERVQAGVLHELRELSDSGHCFAPKGILLERSSLMLEIDAAHVEAAVDALWASERVVVEGDAVYLARLHRAESNVADHVKRLLASPSVALPRAEALLERFEEMKGIQLAPAQRQAVLAAANGKFVVITGGPGVGKTTIVQAILFVLAEENLRVRLAAPTGRAAKRLVESTGREATTIHRLLEVEARGGSFQRNSESPLEVDLLIVDEASMIDVSLMSSLLDATPSAARVVLVGDADQLPSVGPGAVLGDLIASRAVPVARLDVIFRQAGESGIITNSHRILHGELPIGSEDPNGDFFVISCKDAAKAADLVKQIVTKRIPERFKLDPRREVQVLTPMHRGEVGTLALNEALQDALNPEGFTLSGSESRLRLGDKVLQTKNDYEKDVFNGDVGEVARVDDKDGKIVVGFDGPDGTRFVTYEKGELNQLLLAYATSIHKSQGSEYPAVVIPLMTQHFVMLSRNLLYTAVTRAKRLCVLVCDPRALRLALGETRKEDRQTGLRERLANAR